jgi:hypothetical protein
MALYLYFYFFLKLRNTPYALRGSGHNVVQDVYNSRYLHNSYKYIISHIWNQLSRSAKSSTSLSEFRNQIHQSDLLTWLSMLCMHLVLVYRLLILCKYFIYW